MPGTKFFTGIGSFVFKTTALDRHYYDVYTKDEETKAREVKGLGLAHTEWEMEPGYASRQPGFRARNFKHTLC